MSLFEWLHAGLDSADRYMATEDLPEKRLDAAWSSRMEGLVKGGLDLVTDEQWTSLEIKFTNEQRAPAGLLVDAAEAEEQVSHA